MSEREETGRRILAARWIAVVRESTEAAGRRAVEALAAGEAPVVEITLTTPGALERIGALAARAAGPLVGAGSVLDEAGARAARAAGARFLVSPVAPPGLARVARVQDAFLVLGGLTPAELWAARAAGADLVKVFPIGSVGGPDYLRRVLGPFPDLPLLASGGIEPAAIPDYFAAGARVVGVARGWPDEASVRAVGARVRGG